VDLGGRQRPKLAGELFTAELESFFGSFSANQFHGEAGGGDRCFAAEALEARFVDNFPSVFLLKLHPDAEHVATLGIADGADRIGVGQFAHILGIAPSFLDPALEIIVHG
jgi:hypothetical protein